MKDYSKQLYNKLIASTSSLKFDLLNSLKRSHILAKYPTSLICSLMNNNMNYKYKIFFVLFRFNILFKRFDYTRINFNSVESRKKS